MITRHIQDASLSVVLLIMWKRSRCLEGCCSFLWITSEMKEQLNYSVNEAVPSPLAYIQCFNFFSFQYPFFYHQSIILPEGRRVWAEGKLELLLHGNVEAETNHFTKGETEAPKDCLASRHRAKRKPRFSPRTEIHPGSSAFRCLDGSRFFGDSCFPHKWGCLRVPPFTYQGELFSSRSKEYAGKHSLPFPPEQSQGLVMARAALSQMNIRFPFGFLFFIVGNFYFLLIILQISPIATHP